VGLAVAEELVVAAGEGVDPGVPAVEAPAVAEADVADGAIVVPEADTVGVAAGAGVRAWWGQTARSTASPDRAALPPRPDRSAKKCGQGSPAAVQVTRPAAML
jgi:hypothetical protein